MSIDPDLRIALGFILLLRVGIGIFYLGLASESGILYELRRLHAERKWSRRIVWVLLLAPLVPFLLDYQGLAFALYKLNPTFAEFSIMWLPEFLRIQLLIPAVAGLLLLIWSYHCAINPAELEAFEPAGNRYINGPFRILRFPHWVADLLLFGSLLVATDNWVSVISFFAACLVLRIAYLPHAEIAWQRLLGAEYPEYAERTGAVLPRLPSSEDGVAAHYAVPKRFGMSAVIGLMTMFAMTFAGINLLQSKITEFQLTPILHIYFGIQLMLTWIAQMQFGKAPRRISAVVGAILLPTFVFLTIDIRVTHQITLLAVSLTLFGGIIGYCLGAVVAGLFLVMDWLGHNFHGTRGSRSDRPVSP